MPPLLYATIFPSGKGRLKKAELGWNKPPPPAPVMVQSRIGPALNVQPGPQGELGIYEVSNDAFWMTTTPSARTVRHVNVEQTEKTRRSKNLSRIEFSRDCLSFSKSRKPPQFSCPLMTTSWHRWCLDHIPWLAQEITQAPAG